MDYTQLRISTNGYVTFDASPAGAYDNTEFSTGVDLPIVMPFDPADPYANSNPSDPYTVSNFSLPTAYIAPNFVPHDPYVDTDYIYSKKAGVAPNRRFIVQYKLPQEFYVSTKEGHQIYDYQIILFEGTNDILFQYKSITNNIGSLYDPYATNGGGATVGIQGNGTTGTSYQSGQSNYRNSTTWGSTVAPNSGVLSNGLAVGFTKRALTAPWPTPTPTPTPAPKPAPTTVTVPAPVESGGGGGGCIAPSQLFGLAPVLLLLTLGLWSFRRKGK